MTEKMELSTDLVDWDEALSKVKVNVEFRPDRISITAEGPEEGGFRFPNNLVCLELDPDGTTFRVLAYGRADTPVVVAMGLGGTRVWCDDCEEANVTHEF